MSQVYNALVYSFDVLSHLRDRAKLKQDLEQAVLVPLADGPSCTYKILSHQANSLKDFDVLILEEV